MSNTASCVQSVFFSRYTEAKAYTPLSDGQIDNMAPHRFSQSLLQNTGNNMRHPKDNDNWQ